MGLDNDSQPFESDSQMFAGLAPLEKLSDREFSDSEDEGLSSLADHSYNHLTIPESMKNILNMDSSRDLSNIQDDSESDDDSLYRVNTSTNHVNIEEINERLKQGKNKFVNFPLLPDQQEKEDSTKPTKKSKKPKEKKKRRGKGKKADVDIFELEEKARNRNIAKVFEKFAESDSDEEEKKPKKKKGGRKSRKANSNENKVDENGERLVRTTEFLDTDTDDSSDGDRALSKKEELEMTREQERLRRSANARLKPAIVVKSYDEFVKRREKRELDLLNSLEASSQREIEQLIQEQKALEKQQRLNQLLKKEKRPIPLNDDSDDDLIIENDPAQIAAAAMQSPERSRIPIASHFSPVKSSGLNLRNYNKSILSRITTQGYEYRMKMEKSAKAKGQFASATERAKKLLEQERDARMIISQVQSHFEKYGNIEEDEDEEEDGDYGEEEKEGSEEEDEDDEEFGLDEFKAGNSHKRKNSVSDLDSEGEEDIMAKRWKGKKSKKSIFDDSDEEGEVKKTAQKPVPAHSISNFFKAKENEIAAQQPEEDKPLSRLKRRTIQPDIDEDDDAMDIDEPLFVKRSPRSPKPTSSLPLGPREKNEYFEEEAEEEEDEFFGAGGEDFDNGENLDEFEKDDLLVEDNNEHIDEAALRDVFNKQDAESDNNFIKRLLTDVTGGGLRKQKAAAEAGLMIDDIDIYDDEDNDLIAIRRAAAARRRRLLKKKGGDPLENLMTDPKTAAFAKAGQAISEDTSAAFLSDSDVEEIEETIVKSENGKARLVIQEEDDEDEDDAMDTPIEDEQVLVDDFNPMESPLRNTTASPSRFVMRSPMRKTTQTKVVGSPTRNSVLALPLLSNNSSSNITSADDEDDDEIQVEGLPNSFSPLNNRKTKMFKSPVRMERFKRLISETNGTGSDAPRVGFGSLSRSQTQEEEEDVINTRGSIGGFLATGRKNSNENKKSKLSALSKKNSSTFTYAE